MADPVRPKGEEPAEKGPDAGTPLYYTNAVGIVVGLYDFTLIFGHRIGPDKDSGRDLAVAMSPQHAAALHVILGKYLKIYEEKFGAIRLPNDLLEKFEKIEKSNA